MTTILSLEQATAARSAATKKYKDTKDLYRKGDATRDELLDASEALELADIDLDAAKENAREAAEAEAARVRASKLDSLALQIGEYNAGHANLAAHVTKIAAATRVLEAAKGEGFQAIELLRTAKLQILDLARELQVPSPALPPPPYSFDYAVQTQIATIPPSGSPYWGPRPRTTPRVAEPAPPVVSAPLDILPDPASLSEDDEYAAE